MLCYAMPYGDDKFHQCYLSRGCFADGISSLWVVVGWLGGSRVPLVIRLQCDNDGEAVGVMMILTDGVGVYMCDVCGMSLAGGAGSVRIFF